jgi:cytochrome c-type biogenesis protein CcmH/NrfF
LKARVLEEDGKLRTWLFLLLVGVALMAAPGVQAQGGGENLPPGVTPEQVNAIAQQLTCTDCAGVPLNTCQTEVCTEWRQEIADQLGDGKSELDIMDWFVVRYGWNVVIGAVIQPNGLREGVTQDEVNNVAKLMYCDVCEGIPLDACESAACLEWRREIGRMLGVGYDQDQIIDLFVERHGGDVAALPRDKKDLRLVFLVPALIILLIGIVGGYQIWRFRQRGHQAGQVVRRSSSGPMQTRPVPEDVETDLIERLEQELKGLQ